MPEMIVRQPENSQAHFAEVPRADVQRSTFDRSHPWKGTVAAAGDLCPIFWDEILPGDTFNVNATIFLRLATPLKPFMDNLKADMHYFFVPNRLLWNNWQIFMGETRGPSNPNPEDVVMPKDQILMGANEGFGGVADYLGLPIGTGSATVATQINALPFRAYELIWYEWYRDQNIQADIDPPPVGSQAKGRTSQRCYKRNKRKDYFTSALPWPQKGDPVVIPLGQVAEIVTDAALFGDVSIGTYNLGNNVTLKPNVTTDVVEYVNPVQQQPVNLFADLANATATSINDLRTAFQIQRLLERDARGGTRYIELILSHFGVQSEDGRLQRPEYLGAGSAHINVNPIASTTYYEQGAEQVPQGNLSGVGTGLVKAGFKHSFTEHGIVMGILSIQADLTYQQGIDKAWLRTTRYDHYWPALAHLGEQAVLNKELYFNSDAIDDQVFGYQERYAEYRYRPGRISGVFRSTHPQSLDVWHLAQDFESRPNLNATFIAENPPIARVIAVPSEPHFICDAWFDMKCTRPMPVYSVPGMIDHF